MTERVETVKQLIELLKEKDENAEVKYLFEEDKYFALYVEEHNGMILFK